MDALERDMAQDAAERRAGKADEVYVVHYELHSDRVRVFGHIEDAAAFATAAWGSEVVGSMFIERTPVCDHADARRLIEQEG